MDTCYGKIHVIAIAICYRRHQLVGAWSYRGKKGMLHPQVLFDGPSL